MRIGWLTDIHLDFLPRDKRSEFYARVAEEQLDAVLIGGDIGDADSAVPFLLEIEASIQMPIYFVLGNHDFYHGSIAKVREEVARQTANSRWLRWLPAAGIVPLTAKTALVGHDSWADGRFGDFFESDVMLNDYVLIAELRKLGKHRRYAMLNELGDEAADFLASQVRQALAGWSNVLVLTHVPPFRESCWHEGQISNDYCLIYNIEIALLGRDGLG